MSPEPRSPRTPGASQPTFRAPCRPPARGRSAGRAPPRSGARNPTAGARHPLSPPAPWWGGAAALPGRLSGSRAVIRGGSRRAHGAGWGSGRGQASPGPWEAGRRAQEAGLKEGTCSGGGAVQPVVRDVVGGASRGNWMWALGLGGGATAEGAGPWLRWGGVRI